MASGPWRRASAASEVANNAEHQPAVPPRSPVPATSRSRTATRREGSARASERAVHNPVKPPPTMQTSTSMSRVSAGRGGSGAGTASHHRDSRRYPVPSPSPPPSPSRRRGRSYILRHASLSTSRSVEAMKSISSCPADERRGELHHGVASVVGPADQSGVEEAPERNPRSSRSDSSSSNERLSPCPSRAQSRRRTRRPARSPRSAGRRGPRERQGTRARLPARAEGCARPRRRRGSPWRRHSSPGGRRR